MTKRKPSRAALDPAGFFHLIPITSILTDYWVIKKILKPLNHEEILTENSNFKIQFDKRLTETVLKEFKNCEFAVHWNADPTYDKLFLFWKSSTKPITEEHMSVG